MGNCSNSTIAEADTSTSEGVDVAVVSGIVVGALLLAGGIALAVVLYNREQRRTTNSGAGTFVVNAEFSNFSVQKPSQASGGVEASYAVVPGALAVAGTGGRDGAIANETYSN